MYKRQAPDIVGAWVIDPEPTKAALREAIADLNRKAKSWLRTHEDPTDTSHYDAVMLWRQTLGHMASKIERGEIDECMVFAADGTWTARSMDGTEVLASGTWALTDRGLVLGTPGDAEAHTVRICDGVLRTFDHHGHTIYVMTRLSAYRIP